MSFPARAEERALHSQSVFRLLGSAVIRLPNEDDEYV